MRSTLLALSLALVFGSSSADTSAERPCSIERGTVEPIAAGVAYEKVKVDCQHGGPETHTKAHLVTVSLGTDGLSVQSSTPAERHRSDAGTENSSYPLVLPTSVFSERSSNDVGSTPVAQVAINANLFTVCCTVVPTSKRTQLHGLEIANAQVNTSPLVNTDISPPITGATFASSLLVFATGSARIWTATDDDELPSGVATAVTGSHRLLRQVEGRVINRAPRCSGDPDPCAKGQWLGPNARTAAALVNENTLLLLVVDGVDNSEGVSLYQLGDVLISLGAVDAINLDGGGSSTMVQRDFGSDTGFKVLSKLTNPAPSEPPACTVRIPSDGGCERYVGTLLVVQAPSSPTTGRTNGGKR